MSGFYFDCSDDLLTTIDDLIDDGLAASRNDLVREAIQEWMVKKRQAEPSTESKEVKP